MFYVKSCLGPFNGKKYCFKIDGDDNDDLDDDCDFGIRWHEESQYYILLKKSSGGLHRCISVLNTRSFNLKRTVNS